MTPKRSWPLATAQGCRTPDRAQTNAPPAARDQRRGVAMSQLRLRNR
jgi:hypothetical protein